MRSLVRNLLHVGFSFLAGVSMGRSERGQPSVSRQVPSVEADSAFWKVFSPDGIERAVHTSLINLAGLCVELQLDGKSGKIQIDQTRLRATEIAGALSNKQGVVIQRLHAFDYGIRQIRSTFKCCLV